MKEKMWGNLGNAGTDWLFHGIEKLIVNYFKHENGIMDMF